MRSRRTSGHYRTCHPVGGLPVHPLGVYEQVVNSRLRRQLQKRAPFRKDDTMYGLNHRFTDHPLANVTPMGAGATVLVIDRDPIALTLVREAVADHYRVVIAADSGEALALINEHAPAVVLV